MGRGGLLVPISGGTYIVNDLMVQHLTEGILGQHAANLGGILAKNLGSISNKPAYIVDPPVVDEMEPVAKLSGHPKFPRKSIFHALNQKAVARRAAAELGKSYSELDLIVAHLGGGVSVASHHLGNVIDVNNALDGEGPFSPERSGTLPVGDLTRLCFSGLFEPKQIQKMIKGEGGIVAYLGLNDMRKVREQIQAGDKMAELVYKAMAYQVSKEICSHAAVLNGHIDAIILTGGIAFDTQFISWIKYRCSFLAPILVYPGEEEMKALALGALRVLNGTENPKHYSVNKEALK